MITALVFNIARRHEVALQKALFLPHVAGLVSANPDAAILLMAKLRTDKFKIPLDVYYKVAYTLLTSAKTGLSSPKLQSLMKMMGADHEAVSNEQLVMTGIRDAQTYEDLVLLFDLVQEAKSLTADMCIPLIDSYLRTSEHRSESSQRASAWWILKSMRGFANMKIDIPIDVHYRVLQRLVQIKFRNAAAVEFATVRSHPSYFKTVTAEMLVSLVELCSVRSVRPLDAALRKSTEQRRFRVGLDSSTQQFLNEVWEDLESLHSLALSPEAQIPSESAHTNLLKTYAQQGDLSGVRKAYKLLQSRYPTAARNREVCDALIQGAALADDPMAAIDFSRMHLDGGFTSNTARILLSSIRSVSTYHHFAAILKELSQYREQLTAFSLNDEIEGLCQQIVEFEMSGTDSHTFALPVPRLDFPAPQQSTDFATRGKIVIGVRRNVAVHVFVVQNLVNSHLIKIGDQTFETLDEAVAQFSNNIDNRVACVKFGCRTHRALDFFHAEDYD